MGKAGFGGPSAAAPDIAVLHIVVVGHAYGGNFVGQTSDGPSKNVPLAERVEHGGLKRRRFAAGDYAIAADRLIYLIAGPEEDIGLCAARWVVKSVWGKPKSQIQVSRPMVTSLVTPESRRMVPM